MKSKIGNCLFANKISLCYSVLCHDELKKERRDMEKNKIIQVKYDILFHDLFNEEDISTLEWAASQILECEPSELKGRVSVKNVRLTRTNPKERNKYVDLIIEYKNEKIILELNNNYSGIYTRNLFYAFNVLSNYYNTNNYSYYNKDSMFKVILVNLNWYKIKKDDIKSKEIEIIKCPNTNIEDYMLKIMHINLDYYDNIRYDKLEKFDKLYKLLTVSDKEELEYFKNIKELNSYSKKIEILSNSDSYMEAIMSEEMEKNLANEEAYYTGLLDGQLETKTLIVKNLLNKNLSDSEIMELVNISKEELNNIKKEIK